MEADGTGVGVGAGAGVGAGVGAGATAAPVTATEIVPQPPDEAQTVIDDDPWFWPTSERLLPTMDGVAAGPLAVEIK